MGLKLFVLLCVLVALGEARRPKRVLKIYFPRQLVYGQNVMISCVLKKKKVTFEGFFKHDASGNQRKIIADNSKYIILNRPRRRRFYLIVKNFANEDVGKYSCKAGKANVEALLKVEGKVPSSPTAAFLAKSYHAETGKSVTLYCVAKGKFDGFYYESNSKLFPVSRIPGNSYRVFNDGKQLFGSVHRLVISNPDYNQTYFCRSGNYAASTRLYVHQNDGKSVYFSDTAYTVRSNGRVYMRCRGRNYQTAQIYKVNSDDNSLVKVKMQRGFREKIMYKRASINDTGYYLCKDGKNTAVTRYNYAVSIPSTNGQGNPTLKLGQDGVLNLGIAIEDERKIGSGTSLQWYKVSGLHGKVIKHIASKYGRFSATADKRYEWTSKGGGIIIKSVTEEDAGFYAVRHRGARIIFQVDVKK